MISAKSSITFLFLPWLTAFSFLGQVVHPRDCAGVCDQPLASDQELPQVPSEIHQQGVKLNRLALLGGSATILHYVGFKYFDRAWYEGKKLDHIRWIRDWYGDAYLDVDKGGHFLSGLLMARSLTEAYAWSGLGQRTAAILGTVTSWGFLFEIEMRDAYYDQWGFSIPDFTANTIGAGMSLLYTLFPATQAVWFKFSYFPSRQYLEREERSQLPERPHTDHLIDDYEGMTFWMTFAVDRFLWGRAKEVWPDYLGLALGYGAVGLHGSNVKSKGRFKYYKDLPDARPEFILSLDYDTRFLPGQGRVWKWVKTQVNWIHFPAPAVRFYPDWRFYLLYL